MATTTQAFPTAGIYRSYFGLVTIASMLMLIVLMGLISSFYTSVDLLRAGIILIIASMLLDLAFVKSRILKNNMYLAHHGITVFWASIGFFYAETLIEINAGVFVYMLLGAMFRRFWKISKDLFPNRPSLHRLMYNLMAFSDFCDPLVIFIFWDWLMELSTYHRVFYFALAFVRIIINARAYPAIMERLPWGASAPRKL